jgi:hypothetical protein
MTKTKIAAYEPIDLCACFDMLYFPPEDFLEECRIYWLNHNPFHGTIERRIGNTWFTIETECAGTEKLTDKVKRLIFYDKNLRKAGCCS